LGYLGAALSVLVLWDGNESVRVRGGVAGESDPVTDVCVLEPVPLDDHVVQAVAAVLDAPWMAILKPGLWRSVFGAIHRDTLGGAVEDHRKPFLQLCGD
jgi:hypothetical protein